MLRYAEGASSDIKLQNLKAIGNSAYSFIKSLVSPALTRSRTHAWTWPPPMREQVQAKPITLYPPIGQAQRDNKTNRGLVQVDGRVPRATI
jgi:hypothetical protein